MIDAWSIRKELKQANRHDIIEHLEFDKKLKLVGTAKNPLAKGGTLELDKFDQINILDYKDHIEEQFGVHLDQLDKFRVQSDPTIEIEEDSDPQAIPEIEIEHTLQTSEEDDDSPKKINVQPVQSQVNKDLALSFDSRKPPNDRSSSRNSASSKAKSSVHKSEKSIKPAESQSPKTENLLSHFAF